MLAGVHHARIPKSMKYAMDDLRRRKEIADVQTEPAPPRKWKNSPHYLGGKLMAERPQDRGKRPAGMPVATYRDAKIDLARIARDTAIKANAEFPPTEDQSRASAA